MALVTKQQLIDAGLDTVTVKDVVNGAAAVDVVSRLGQVIPSLSKIMAELASYVIRGPWVTATAYSKKDLVTVSTAVYVCLVAHTSSVFNTDLAAGKWAVYQGSNNPLERNQPPYTAIGGETTIPVSFYLPVGETGLHVQRNGWELASPDYTIGTASIVLAEPASKDDVFEIWAQPLLNNSNPIGTLSSDAVNLALAAQAAAEVASALAIAAADFKGSWSTLTGALNKPASVYHQGYYWALLNNLANVTTSQPGVSADWVKVPVSQGLDIDESPKNRQLGTCAYISETFLKFSVAGYTTSIAAGATVNVSLTAPGVDIGDEVVSHALSISRGGQRVIAMGIDAQDVVTMTINNPTGGAVALAAHTVHFCVRKHTPEA